MMKKIVLFMSAILTIGFGAGDFTVMLSCDKLPEYQAICAEDTAPSEIVSEAPIYTMSNRIVWGYGDNDGSAYVGSVEVRYLDEAIPVFITATNELGKFTIEILPNESFFVYAYDNITEKWSTHKEKFILRIGSSTGNLLWKEWKPSTSRWIKLDLDSNVNLEPIVISKVANIKVSNITSNGALITWEGQPDAEVWVQVKGTTSEPFVHIGINNSWEFKQLGSGYDFVLTVRDSDGVIQQQEFSTP